MNKLIARKQAGWLVVFTFPDVCKTPIGSSTVPVPYPVTGKLTDTMNASPNVFANGHPLFLHKKSKVRKTLGDQAGIARGTTSNSVGGKCASVEYVKNVYANKKNLVVQDQKAEMNI